MELTNHITVSSVTPGWSDAGQRTQCLAGIKTLSSLLLSLAETDWVFHDKQWRMWGQEDTLLVTALDSAMSILLPNHSLYLRCCHHHHQSLPCLASLQRETKIRPYSKYILKSTLKMIVYICLEYFAIFYPGKDDLYYNTDCLNSGWIIQHF